ncbi:MAG: asparagine synthase-related protein [Candidatus Bathyarchaeum tardum]|nr:MAG: asparagine synthase-related protein [Candidatus Bathyarchaeum tardum]
MVNFVIVIDTNIKQRTKFITKIKSLISPVDGLSVFEASNSELSSIWASGSWTPVSQLNDTQGVATIWGDAINQQGYEKITAKQLRKYWNESSNIFPVAFDGFHAAFVYNSKKGLVIGADLLGFFPIYYYSTDDVLLVGSSPELFRHHKSFKKELNPTGLVGIFLTNGLINGQTLLKGVKRLKAGHILMWKSGEEPRELNQYNIPASTKYFNLPFSEQLELVDQALERAFTRHTATDSKYSLLLSGGLDSRLIGGYLKQRGINVTALTEGLSTDIEMKCAVKVARKLGFEHYKVSINPEKYLFCARIKNKWEHLANGFSGVTRWGLYPYLRELAPNVVVGYAADIILGKTCLQEYNSFEKIFNKMNKWGFSKNSLTKILKPEFFEDSIHNVFENIRKVYDKYSKLEFQKVNGFWLNHRARFHVGSSLWTISFGAWPIVPFIDNQVLEVIGGMPFNILADRKMEIELLNQKFPKLARLPLDRNFYNTTPLMPTYLQRVKQYVYGKANFMTQGQFSKTQHKLMKMKGERRYYYRIYDFNNPGWQTIRQNADVNQSIAMNLFNKNELQKLLPKADIKVEFEDEIINSARLKIMIGFLLWLKHISLNQQE